MAGIDSTDLSIIRILEILKKHTDENHPMTQNEILERLRNEYGIDIERKAVGRKINLLDSADIYITKTPKGCYFDNRLFDEAELRLLIDCVLSSRHINDAKTKDIIEKLCSGETIFFKKSLKHIHYIHQWQNTESHDVFNNIDKITNAIENKFVINFEYYKYDKSKKLTHSSWENLSPYTMVLHNQRYYLMGYSPYWDRIKFVRIDRMKDIKVKELKYRELKTIEGYESGLDYKELSVGRPYLFSDKLENIKLKVNKNTIDYVVDWFGTEIKINDIPDNSDFFEVEVKSSPDAMVYWALQFVKTVEVISPISLRQRIGEALMKGISSYSDVMKEQLQKETAISHENNETSIFYNINPPIVTDEVEDLTKEFINNKQ